MKKDRHMHRNSEMTGDIGMNNDRPLLRRLLVAGLVATVVLVGATGCGSSSSDDAAGIEVTNARIPEPSKPDVAAVYLSITNTGSDDDVLESATTTAGGTAEIHLTEMVDGVASMKEVAPVTIEGGTTVEFEPGGYHVMIMGPSPLKEGDQVEVTLKFKNAGEIVTEAPVLAAADVFAGTDGPMPDHGAGDDSGSDDGMGGADHGAGDDSGSDGGMGGADHGS